jgi:hypothetical protein
MYLRIFPTNNFRIGSYILGLVTIAWVIAINFVSIFQCTPVKKAWMGPAIDGTCINLKASFIGNAVPNILTDVAILCMPVAQVLKLQVTAAQRASLLFMFLLGGLSVLFHLNWSVFVADCGSQRTLRQCLPLCNSYAI